VSEGGRASCMIVRISIFPREDASGGRFGGFKVAGFVAIASSSFVVVSAWFGCLWRMRGIAFSSVSMICGLLGKIALTRGDCLFMYSVVSSPVMSVVIVCMYTGICTRIGGIIWYALYVVCVTCLCSFFLFPLVFFCFWNSRGDRSVLVLPGVRFMFVSLAILVCSLSMVSWLWWWSAQRIAQ